MIIDKTVKHTKTNQMMAFITVEDLLGTVEVVVFPRDYEKNREYLEVGSSRGTMKRTGNISKWTAKCSSEAGYPRRMRRPVS